jgi:hypothetical protein
LNIKLNDTSDNEENTAGFIQEDYYRVNGRDSDNSKGEKSQQRIRQAFLQM